MRQDVAIRADLVAMLFEEFPELDHDDRDPIITRSLGFPDPVAWARQAAAGTVPVSSRLPAGRDGADQ